MDYITIGRKRGTSEDVLIFGRKTLVTEQYEFVRQCAIAGKHPIYSEVICQSVDLSDCRRAGNLVEPEPIQEHKKSEPKVKTNRFAPVLALVMFAFLALTTETQAQLSISSLMSGGTNNVAGATTNAYTGLGITIPYSRFVTLQPSFALTGTGNSNITFVVDSSIDNAVWNTGAYRINVTASGTNTVTTISTIQLDSVAFLRLSGIENPLTNSVAATNIVLKYSFKRGF